MPLVEEDDDDDNYTPNPQIKAMGICVNDDGSEDFVIDYHCYQVEGEESGPIPQAFWSCNKTSSTSMYVVSLGSRIVGDAMYDSPAPDAQPNKLHGNRSTIVNPRKVYSLTVVRLEWKLTNFENDFNAECSGGDGHCRGLKYLLGLPLVSTNRSSLTNQYLLVGESSIAVNSLKPYSYDITSGTPVAPRWVPLMTLATPAEDVIFSPKSDVLFCYNFKSCNWSCGMRSGHNCSDSAEDFLNYVVSNHYYLENRLQVSYTAGMYFLFKDGIVRDVIDFNGTGRTLAFDGNTQRIDIKVSIPMKSLILTCTGIGLILLGVISAMIFTRCGSRSLIKHPHHITMDIVADMLLNDTKYPPHMIKGLFDSADLNGAFKQFRIAGLVLYDEKTHTTRTILDTDSKTLSDVAASEVRVASFATQDLSEASTRKSKAGEPSYVVRKSDTEESTSSSKSSETSIIQT